MMIQAVLGNPNHPEYGVATIPFPIPHDQYAHCMELLEALEIGDAVKVDCKVEKIDSFYTVLKRTEMLTVNVEELNYLAKRLDSFDTGEAAQFQAMAHKLELFELKDLIKHSGKPLNISHRERLIQSHFHPNHLNLFRRRIGYASVCNNFCRIFSGPSNQQKT